MDYVNTMISHFRKMDDELIKSDRLLFDFVEELIVDNRNNRRAIEKLDQQLNDLRKELDALKKDSQD